jgi:hypothetical protein
LLLLDTLEAAISLTLTFFVLCMLFVIFYEDGDIFIQFKSYEQFKMVIYDTASCSFLLIIVICKDIAFCLTDDF